MNIDTLLATYPSATAAEPFVGSEHQVALVTYTSDVACSCELCGVAVRQGDSVVAMHAADTFVLGSFVLGGVPVEFEPEVTMVVCSRKCAVDAAGGK